VNSDLSLGISYAGKALDARTKYSWNLQVWDQKNHVSRAKSSFETGLLNESWNEATWIGSNDLPLYSDYLSVYKIQYAIQLDEASKSKKRPSFSVPMTPVYKIKTSTFKASQVRKIAPTFDLS